MPRSEDSGGGGGGGGRAQLAGCSTQPAPRPASPFRFQSPRCLIDWRALHSLDLAAVQRDCDLDALEGVLDTLRCGDLEAEDARRLAPADFVQLFRAAQLALDYLLHVQERLVGDARAAAGEAARLRAHERLAQLAAKEARQELAGARREARQLKKSMRSFEVGGVMAGGRCWVACLGEDRGGAVVSAHWAACLRACLPSPTPHPPPHPPPLMALHACRRWP